MVVNADWIAVDWGTSSLRVWAMSEAGEALAEIRSDQGMGRLERNEFEPTLMTLIADWLDTRATPIRIVVCGMAGAAQGWADAGYAAVPCKPETAATTPVATASPRIDVRILGGVSQLNPADVMRGEETQIAGFHALHPNFDGVICLPGSHTKWAHVSAGEIVSFQTFMTGEMFAALSGHTVLRHSIDSEQWDDAAFAEALSDTLSRPEKLASKLFGIRARGLVDTQSTAEATARLSGYLIGAEIAAAKPYWLGQNVALVGDARLCDRYATALDAQGITAQRADVTQLTLAGLTAAYRNSKASS
ncbi:2-dehydro-3-deoxygalactonokinase [Celeribacter sp.]|uniref:2-dehydro-3-deoxygalactonokinase n=1 Tax=Celeribacter sp. TaxID=1890673 RepID=UPI003A8ED9A2